MIDFRTVYFTQGRKADFRRKLAQIYNISLDELKQEYHYSEQDA